jgi:hypothetical protein
VTGEQVRDFPGQVAGMAIPGRIATVLGESSACPVHPGIARAPHCHTYVACPTAYRDKCNQAGRCTGEDEVMG